MQGSGSGRWEESGCEGRRVCCVVRVLRDLRDVRGREGGERVEGLRWWCRVRGWQFQKSFYMHCIW